jgi:DNA repair photolyase
MGTNTDPYQRAEGKYELMPGIIRALTDYRNPFSILTRGPLLLRDRDLLVDAAKVTDIHTAFSIPTLDEEAWRKTEPYAPDPRKRMEAVRKLNEAGIPCGVMVAPILPHITDDPDKLMDVVKAAVDAGATHITPIFLHLRPVVREHFMGWLQETYPSLISTYEDLYATGAYGPRSQRQALANRVRGLVAAAGGLRLLNPPDRRSRKAPVPAGQRTKQLELL